MKTKYQILFLLLPTICELVIVQFILKIPLSTPLYGEIPNTFLATVAGVLSGLLAIVFSISLLAVQIYSEKYTSRAFSYIQKNWISILAFSSSLGCILISVVAIGIQTIPMTQILFLIMNGFFVFSIMTMVLYSINVIQLLNPKNLVKEINKDAIKYSKLLQRELFLEMITLLGDISIKSLTRSENQISKEYLYNLSVLQPSISRKLILSSSNKWEYERGLFDKAIISPIVKQLFRVYKKSCSVKDDEISQYIVGLLHTIISNLVFEELKHQNQIIDNKITASAELDSEIIENFKGIIIYQYPEFVELAIQYSDESRFHLLSVLRQQMFSPYLIDNPNDNCLNYFCNSLYQINKYIIKYDDFVLWTDELTSFSNTSIRGDFNGNENIEQQYYSFHQKIRDLISTVLLSDIILDDDQINFLENASYFFRFRITDNNRKLYKTLLSDIQELIPKNNLEIRKQLTYTQRTLSKLWVTTSIYDTFFHICVFACYKKKYQYIKELWQHVNPSDTNTHYFNANMIYFNIEFLTHQMMNLTILPWALEDFHGSESYVYQYYFLCLANSLENNYDDNKVLFQLNWSELPKATLNIDPKHYMIMREELRSNYIFFKNLPHRLDKVAEEYMVVVQNENSWTNLFNNSNPLIKANNWVTNKANREKWINNINQLISNLPIEKKIIQAYIKKAKEFHEESNKIKSLAMVGDEHNSKVLLKTIRSISYTQKLDFTIIGFNENEIFSRIGSIIINNLFTKELDHLLRTIRAHKKIEKEKIIKCFYNEIVAIYKFMTDDGFPPTNILLSTEHYLQLNRNDPFFKNNVIIDEKNNYYLRINSSTKLNITLTRDNNNLYLLNQKSGVWNIIQPVNIDIIESKTNPMNIDLSSTEEISYHIVEPKFIHIIKTRPLSE